MLLFRNAGEETHAHLSPEQKKEMTKKWNDWFEGLAARGKAQHGHPLGLDGRVVSGARGERVTDGPFAETKELIGGYAIVQANSHAEAVELARRFVQVHIEAGIQEVEMEIRPLSYPGSPGCTPA
jgi:hypothetical protein